MISEWWFLCTTLLLWRSICLWNFKSIAWILLSYAPDKIQDWKNEQMEITPKVWNFELRFLWTALHHCLVYGLICIYLLIPFLVKSFYFKDLQCLKKPFISTIPPTPMKSTSQRVGHIASHFTDKKIIRMFKYIYTKIKC